MSASSRNGSTSPNGCSPNDASGPSGPAGGEQCRRSQRPDASERGRAVPVGPDFCAGRPAAGQVCSPTAAFRDGYQGHDLCGTPIRLLPATTSPEEARQPDIATGKSRRLNLQATPFDCPEPLRLLNDGCAEGDGRFRDRSPGPGELAALPDQSALLPAGSRR